MVLFFPAQQELDCISGNGNILGKIKFDLAKDEYVFHADEPTTKLSSEEEARIIEKLAGLASGKYALNIQDED